MNCFSRTIAHLGLNADSQGDNGWLYLLLASLAAAGVQGADAFPTNPPRSALARLDAFRETHAYQRLAAMLNSAIVQLDR